MADVKVKVSSLPAATVANETDLLYLVQGGISKKLPFSVVMSMLTVGDVLTGTFDNSDLMEEGIYTLVHNKDTDLLMLVIFDPNGYTYNVPWKKKDSDPTNSIEINFGGYIETGNWSYLLAYWNPGNESASDELTKIVDIGDWNMDANSSKTVSHGLTLNKIRSITGMIRSDDGLNQYPIPAPRGVLGLTMGLYVSYIDSTNVYLGIDTPSDFDSTGFDSIGYNRGWLTIKYIA